MKVKRNVSSGGVDYLRDECDYVEDRQIPYCKVHDLFLDNYPDYCRECFDTHYYDGSDCLPCDEFRGTDSMEGCRTCTDESVDFECTSCLTGYSLKTNGTGVDKCVLTHCKEGNFTSSGICTECLEGFVWNQDGTCSTTCTELGYEEDYPAKVCRFKCLSTQYQHPTSTANCLECSALLTPVANRCTKCDYTDGVVGKYPMVCEDCVNAMTPDATNKCVVQNCKTINTADPTKCDVCNPGFLRAYDSTRCYPVNVLTPLESCPSKYISYPTQFICGETCSDGYYADPTTKICK